MRRGLLGLLLLLSGAAALCYEVAWTRHLVLVFGNTTRAVALLLGAYMLGLALGSEVGGRLADRTRRPALLYAAFEIAIGGFALAFPWLVDAVRGVYLGLGTSASPVLFGLAFLLLVVPTFCMGTTLPLLARATIADPARTGRDVGFLYAANIVGAVLGAAGTGFFLMEAAGVLGATRWAAAVNGVVGVVGFLAFRGGAGERPTSQAAPPPPGPPPAAKELDAAAAIRRAAMVSAFASGFVGLAAQVVWTRLLTFFLNGFTWTFTAILATFLTGLALGGWFFGRRASRTKRPELLLVRLHLAVGVACAAVLWAISRQNEIPGAFWSARSLWETAGTDATDMSARHRLTLVLAAGAVLLVPSFLMGGCLPVATALAQRGLDDLGSRVGRVFAVNTAGCVLGSLVAGFVLQPLLGPSLSAAVVVGVAILLALVVAAVGRVIVPVAGLALPLAAGAIVWAAHPTVPILRRSHVFTGAAAREVELESTRNGAVCTVSVVRNTRERFRLLYTDEFQAAGTKPEYRYMRMLAHLPVALARDPSRTLVICFGTGTTAGSVATHSDVKTLDIVEISPEVLETADVFRDVNKDVLHGAGRRDLDVRVHVDDGRHFVLRSAETWGVVSLEPLMPYTPAAIHLYTREFYETCRARLAPGGLMCQWIPLQGMSGDDFKRLVAAFVAVYPESAMFFVDGAVALIGGPDGVDLSWRRVSGRLADPRVAADLRAVGFADPARALATFVSGGKRLRDFVDGVPPVTDEFPVLEFHPIPPGVALPWLGQNLQHMRNLVAAWDRVPVDFADEDDAERASGELYVALRAESHVLEGLLHVAIGELRFRQGEPQESIQELAAARDQYRQALAVDPGNETARRLRDGLEREWWTIQGSAYLDGKTPDPAAAERDLLKALRHEGQRQADVVWTRLAEARSVAGRPDAALEAACEATRLFPGGLEARAERACARSALGDVEGAAADYLRALRGEPTSVLSDRLRRDADRALAAFPEPTDRAADAAGLGAPPRWDAPAVEPPRLGKIPRRLVLRIVAADDPEGFRKAHAADLVPPPRADLDDPSALAAIARLREAAPEGAAETLAAWLATDRVAVHKGAAEGLVELDGDRARALLEKATAGSAATALARAAGLSTDRRFVRPLIRLLRCDDPALRRAARDSLFGLVGEAAPRLATLDTSDANSADYRRDVLEIGAWWARQGEE